MPNRRGEQMLLFNQAYLVGTRSGEGGGHFALLSLGFFLSLSLHVAVGIGRKRRSEFQRALGK